MGVTVRDDHRICWECGPLLYRPYVTTCRDGSGLECGQRPGWSLPKGTMKTAQVLQRMWLQAGKKLGLLKGHVSLSLPALAPSSFPTFPFRKGLGGGGGGGAAKSLPPFSVGLFLLAAFRNRLGDADGSQLWAF